MQSDPRLNQILTGARKSAQEGYIPEVISRLTAARMYARQKRIVIPSFVIDEIMKLGYEMGVYVKLRRAKNYSTSDPDFAVMELKDARRYSNKVGMNIEIEAKEIESQIALGKIPLIIKNQV